VGRRVLLYGRGDVRGPFEKFVDSPY
jgi:hypothetical protein